MRQAIQAASLWDVDHEFGIRLFDSDSLTLTVVMDAKVKTIILRHPAFDAPTMQTLQKEKQGMAAALGVIVLIERLFNPEMAALHEATVTQLMRRE